LRGKGEIEREREREEEKRFNLSVVFEAWRGEREREDLA
jgi:hypothetical protein